MFMLKFRGRSSNIDKFWYDVQWANIDLNNTFDILKLIACSSHLYRYADVVMWFSWVQAQLDLFMHNFLVRTILFLKSVHVRNKVRNILMSTPNTSTMEWWWWRRRCTTENYWKLHSTTFGLCVRKHFIVLYSKNSTENRFGPIRDEKLCKATIAAITKN